HRRSSQLYTHSLHDALPILTTFGCQMNEHDSERMKGMLESLGYTEAPSRDEADLILFNTCSIREKADNRLVGHLGEAKRLKAERSEEHTSELQSRFELVCRL